ncbi:hypothetical protein BaRGS_00024093 [Batillaria attramentaria]|uniref:Uncharacterized protein n=1 Tax=Batillaria attramentaria TaxID=370345 RepID=A0ABD0KCH4_9CAEN
MQLAPDIWNDEIVILGLDLAERSSQPNADCNGRLRMHSMWTEDVSDENSTKIPDRRQEMEGTEGNVSHFTEDPAESQLNTTAGDFPKSSFEIVVACIPKDWHFTFPHHWDLSTLNAFHTPLPGYYSGRTSVWEERIASGNEMGQKNKKQKVRPYRIVDAHLDGISAGGEGGEGEGPARLVVGLSGHCRQNYTTLTLSSVVPWVRLVDNLRVDSAERRQASGHPESRLCRHVRPVDNLRVNSADTPGE